MMEKVVHEPICNTEWATDERDLAFLSIKNSCTGCGVVVCMTRNYYDAFTHRFLILVT